jgi:hypothetical protein
MLKSEELQIQTGRAGRGDFIRIVHTPTGISRTKHPPLGSDAAQREFQQLALKEIEIELQQKGLSHYLLPDVEPSQQQS